MTEPIIEFKNRRKASELERTVDTSLLDIAEWVPFVGLFKHVHNVSNDTGRGIGAMKSNQVECLYTVYQAAITVLPPSVYISYFLQ